MVLHPKKRIKIQYVILKKTFVIASVVEELIIFVVCENR